MSLRREYSAVRGVYPVLSGAEEEVVTLTPRGNARLKQENGTLTTFH